MTHAKWSLVHSGGVLKSWEALGILPNANFPASSQSLGCQGWVYFSWPWLKSIGLPSFQGVEGSLHTRCPGDGAEKKNCPGRGWVWEEPLIIHQQQTWPMCPWAQAYMNSPRQSPRQLFLQTLLLYTQPNRLACQFTDPQMWIHIPSSYLESPDVTTVKLIKQGDPCTEVALQSEATPKLSLEWLKVPKSQTEGQLVPNSRLGFTRQPSTIPFLCFYTFSVKSPTAPGSAS